MKLSDIYSNDINIIESVISLFSNPTITEGKTKPWWPEEWAERAFSNSTFLNWLKDLGIVGERGKVMAGGVGRAYPIGDKFIIKFTLDDAEARAAAVIKGHDSDHAATIYDVKRIMTVDDPRFQNSKRVNLYVIAMERLNTNVGKRMRAAGNAVYTYLDHNPGFIEDPDQVINDILAEPSGDDIDYLGAKYRYDPVMPDLVRKMVMAVHDVQERTGVLTKDTHGANIALKNKKPAFFDFGRSGTIPDHPKTNGARITGLK